MLNKLQHHKDSPCNDIVMSMFIVGDLRIVIAAEYLGPPFLHVRNIHLGE